MPKEKTRRKVKLSAPKSLRNVKPLRAAKRILNKTPLRSRNSIPTASRTRKILDEQSLINLESSLGSAVFGRPPAGTRREFFYHRRNLWIYHEQIGDNDPLTITYEVHIDGVIKILPNRTQHAITGEELQNFLAAARTYQVLIEEYLYDDVS